MPFGMSWDEFRSKSAAAKTGDATAAAEIHAGAGLHVHPAARVALGLGAAVVGARAAGLPGLSISGSRTDPVITPTGTGVTRTNANGGSGTGVGGIGGAILDVGLDWLRRRAGGSPGTELVSSQCPQGQVGKPPACFDVQPGGATQGGGLVVFSGEAVMGRYGAALQPATRSVTIKRCPRGAVLGNDGLCYNKRDLKRHDRMWIPGRKPLLTGGDLNAIARAARAAGKMKTQQKRLQKLGLLPKPTRGGARARGPKALPASSTTTVIDT